MSPSPPNSFAKQSSTCCFILLSPFLFGVLFSWFRFVCCVCIVCIVCLCVCVFFLIFLSIIIVSRTPICNNNIGANDNYIEVIFDFFLFFFPFCRILYLSYDF